MGTQKFCDHCGFMRQNKDGTSAVHRYGLSRQVPDPTKTRRNGGQAFKRERHYGSIDLCDDCWNKIAKPKTRPELRGKTHPKRIEEESAEVLTLDPAV